MAVFEIFLLTKCKKNIYGDWIWSISSSCYSAAASQRVCPFAKQLEQPAQPASVQIESVLMKCRSRVMHSFRWYWLLNLNLEVLINSGYLRLDANSLENPRRAWLCVGWFFQFIFIQFRWEYEMSHMMFCSWRLTGCRMQSRGNNHRCCVMTTHSEDDLRLCKLVYKGNLLL